MRACGCLRTGTIGMGPASSTSGWSVADRATPTTTASPVTPPQIPTATFPMPSRWTRRAVRRTRRPGAACRSAGNSRGMATTATAFGSAYSSLEDEIIAALPATMKANGQVYTPYSCIAFDITPAGTAATDIEHIVALAEAHDSRIADDRRREIASDLLNLTIADPTVNRSQKSDRDAAEWMPTRHGAWFAERVIQIKRKYGLSVDPAERDALDRLLGGRETELSCVEATTAAPTVMITSTASAPVNGPFPISITFSASVTGFGLGDLVVGNGSASDVRGIDADYTATTTPTASGRVTVDIAAGAAEDSAGNPSAAASQFSILADLDTVAVPFTDDPIVPGVTRIKAIHVTELRTRIDAARTSAGLGRFAWTDPVLIAGVTPVRLTHLLELRAALTARLRGRGAGSATLDRFGTGGGSDADQGGASDGVAGRSGGAGVTWQHRRARRADRPGDGLRRDARVVLGRNSHDPEAHHRRTH